MIQTEIINTNIQSIDPIKTPIELMREIPNNSTTLVAQSRQDASDILHGRDDERLLLIVGPCSIHDINAAYEYGEKLARFSKRVDNSLKIFMRLYGEKPRTVDGWKGLVYDPNLDGSMDDGLSVLRQLLANINGLGLPAAIEVLDPISPQYLDDLVSWGAIGARTVESQVHRQLASGLSMPLGMKNSTEGDPKVAVDAMQAAANPHTFFSLDEYGRPARVRTTGNPDTHIILRGGNRGTNYDAASVNHVLSLIDNRGLLEKTSRPVMIDASHGNSRKDYQNQPGVIRDALDQMQNGQRRIMGFMIESNLFEGQQKLIPGKQLEYGVSITDGCIGWEATERLLLDCAKGVEPKRYVLT